MCTVLYCYYLYRAGHISVLALSVLIDLFSFAAYSTSRDNLDKYQYGGDISPLYGSEAKPQLPI